MIDLHTHLGGAVPSAVLWEVLCDAGLQTEFKTFNDLQDYLTVEPGSIQSLDDFLGRYFHTTELIQSSPQAAAISAYQAIVKAYRRASITGMELRYNPLKRLKGSLHTLDAVIVGTIQGLQRACLHYADVRTGILFSMGKELSIEENASIVHAAGRFVGWGRMGGAFGVVGIDMAGPESLGRDLDKGWLKQIGSLTEGARQKGLGLTWHVGETDFSGAEGMIAVIETIRPDRIGHGIALRKAQGKQKEKLCGLLRDHQICLELCPSVNKVTRSISALQEIADLIRLLDKENIPFCLNTDNPYLIHTNLQNEYRLIEDLLGQGSELLRKSLNFAEQHTFLKTKDSDKRYACVW